MYALTVHADNVVARNLYEKFGFITERAMRGYLLVHREILWSRDMAQDKIGEIYLQIIRDEKWRTVQIYISTI
jgi:RimJ/RimL family protein N-acetyltransferase